MSAKSRLRDARYHRKWQSGKRNNTYQQGFGLMLRGLKDDDRKRGIGKRAYWIISRDSFPRSKRMSPDRKISIAQQRVFARMDLPF